MHTLIDFIARSIEILNIEWSIKSDNAGMKNEMAPRQGKKNLAKFLGIDMSALALADADTDTGNIGAHHDLGTLANIDTHHHSISLLFQIKVWTVRV